MKLNKKNHLNIIKEAAKLYESNLLNQNIVFIYSKEGKLKFYEVIFLKEHFKHLTGVKSRLNAYEFFYRATKNRLRLEDFDYKNNTTILKLDNLLKCMSIGQYSKMIGEYKQNKYYLSIEKLVGNNNLAIGFDSGETINYPKTLLKADIREYTQKTYRIVGILSKNRKEEEYRKINYMANNITIDKLLKSKEINQKLRINIMKQ